MKTSNFDFSFTEQEINLILSGLGKLPAEMSLKLILEIQKEASEQIKNLETTDTTA
jgi:hypothetical protein